MFEEIQKSETMKQIDSSEGFKLYIDEVSSALKTFKSGTALDTNIPVIKMEIEISDCMQTDLIKALHHHRARKEWDLSIQSNVEISHKLKNYHPEMKLIH